MQSRQLIREKGIDAISIRNVANACHVSIGSIYNYFTNKADLVSATHTSKISFNKSCLLTLFAIK